MLIRSRALTVVFVCLHFSLLDIMRCVFPKSAYLSTIWLHVVISHKFERYIATGYQTQYQGIRFQNFWYDSSCFSKVCLLINKLIHTCFASVGISHELEINIATISKHNTKGLDFSISDMILQGLCDPHQAGEMAFKLALIYITVPIRVPLQNPFYSLG